MTRLDDAQPPEGGQPGWYRDPLGEADLRLFDGKAWTSTIQPAEQGVPAPGGAAEGKPRTEGIWSHWSRLPRWTKWTVGVVGVLLLLGVGSAMGSSNEDGLKKEVSALEARLATTREERSEAQKEASEAEGRASRVEGLRGKIVGEAQKRAATILASAKQEKEELSSLKGEIKSAEGELAAVESSLSGARATKAKSTIPGDGTFKAEVDYLPGTYRSSGGPTCYWATLNSADPYDIASNENTSGPAIASINSPYFQTKGCGTWKRIGE